jgi:glucan phosphoethanolaminetransferase (alkaline phosphatase superfamily)
MDIFIIYFLILLVLLLILIGIVYLSYWIPKKMGKRKLGIILSRILSVGLVIIVLSFIFEDNLYSKTDAKKSLSERNIELKDDFRILDNQSGGLRDYYHRFELEISESDKNRLIDKITSELNYTNEIQNSFHLPDKAINRNEGDTLFANYQTDWDYKSEIYYPNGKGYTPTYKIISISKKENKLTFEHILD